LRGRDRARRRGLTKPDGGADEARWRRPGWGQTVGTTRRGGGGRGQTEGAGRGCGGGGRMGGVWELDQGGLDAEIGGGIDGGPDGWGGYTH
jgi:hypothetical protein